MKGLAAALPGARPLGPGVAIAALVALAMLATGAGLLFDAAQARIELAGRRVTVAVVDADPAQQHARAETVAAMLRGRTDLGDVQAVPEGTVRAETGNGALPSLVDATLVAGADETRLAEAVAGLPGVSVARATALPIEGLHTSARIARLVALVAILAGLAVGAGLAFAIDAEALALVERLGAHDRQIVAAALFGAGRPLLTGAAIGAAFAVPFIAWQAQVTDIGAMHAIPISGWAWLAIVAALVPALGAVGVGATTALRLAGRP